MFYHAENIFRWYEMVTDGKQVQQSQKEKTIIRYRNLLHDDLEKMQETICSPDDLEKWLKRKQLPPDGYEYPFNGTYDTALVENMMVEIRRFTYVKRFYALLDDENANVCDLLNVAMYCFLDEEQIDEQLRLIHMKKYIELLDETDDEHMRMNIQYLFQSVLWRFQYENQVNGQKGMSASRKDVAKILVDYLSCVDECFHMLLGFSPTMQDTFVCAKILSAIWADICRQSGAELQEELGCDKGYKARNSQITIPWWRNSEASDAIKEQFEAQREYVKSRVEYYIGLSYDGTFRYKRFPGELHKVDNEYGQENSNAGWKTIEEMLADVLSGEFYIKGSNLWKFLVSSMDAFLATHMNNSKLQINTQKALRVFVSDKIVDSLYVSLGNRIMDGDFHYRKCLLCDRYFDYGNKANRKYCDIHNGPNAEYYRRILNRKLSSIT